MTAPYYKGMNHTRTVRTDGRIEHHYTTCIKPEECPHCGCKDLSPSGYRTPSCRHDVEDGMPVYLVVRKAQFDCADCSRRFPVESPVPLANNRTTLNFWEKVVNSGLSLKASAAKFATSVETVKSFRRFDGKKKPRKQMKPRKRIKLKPENRELFILPDHLPWAANKNAPITMRGLAA